MSTSFEPTRQEWKDWAAVMSAKEERPRSYGLYEYYLGLIGLKSELRAEMIGQAYIDQSNQQAGCSDRCKCGIFGGIFG